MLSSVHNTDRKEDKCPDPVIGYMVRNLNEKPHTNTLVFHDKFNFTM